MNIIDSKF